MRIWALMVAWRKERVGTKSKKLNRAIQMLTGSQKKTHWIHFCYWFDLEFKTDAFTERDVHVFGSGWYKSTSVWFGIFRLIGVEGADVKYLVCGEIFYKKSRKCALLSIFKLLPLNKSPFPDTSLTRHSAYMRIHTQMHTGLHLVINVISIFFLRKSIRSMLAFV